MVTTTKTKPKPDEFALDAILGKYATKPDPLATPELYLLYSQAGSGKGLVHGTRVYTPDGYTNIEDLEVGDLVIGSDGKPVRVYGIWDRGEQSVYDVEFLNGTHITTDGDHLWTLQRRDYPWEVLNTKQVMDKLADNKVRVIYKVPMVAPVEHTRKELPLDPYFLGALIADGYLAGSSIQWSKGEQSVIDAVQACGWETREGTFDTSTTRQWYFRDNKKLTDILESLDLRCKSAGKFIPEDYLYSSVDDRRALLAGLFDGDGRVRSSRGNAQYHSVSQQLAQDVAQLCRSLGIACSVTSDPLSEGTYRVNLTDGTDPFRYSKHKGSDKLVHSSHPYRNGIVSVTPVGFAETRCIAVESPDQLFVTEHYTLTHNTHLASSAVDVSPDTKVLYIDVEGSSPGVITTHKNWKNIDVIRVDQMEATDEERENGVTNGIKRFKFLRSLLSEKNLFSGKETKYDYIVVDTFDVAQDYAIEYFQSTAPVARNGEVDGFKVWGNVKDWTLTVAKGLKSMQPVGILVQHDREEKEASGAIIKKLALSGSAKDILPGIPDVVLYLERKLIDGDETTIGYFASQDGKVTKNRFNFPAKVKNPSIPKLIEFIKNNSKEGK